MHKTCDKCGTIYAVDARECPRCDERDVSRREAAWAGFFIGGFIGLVVCIIKLAHYLGS